MQARIINILTVLCSAIEFQTTHNVAKTNFWMWWYSQYNDVGDNEGGEK